DLAERGVVLDTEIVPLSADDVSASLALLKERVAKVPKATKQPTPYRRTGVWALGAALVLMGVMSVRWLDAHTSSSPRRVYATAAAERAVVSLPDGSR